MKVRSLKPSDIPALHAMQKVFPYPDLDAAFVESIRVVVDDDDKPLMAVAAKRLVELYLWCGAIKRPHAQMYALRLLHEDMASQLRAKGYTSVEAFLPPPVAKRFAKRLQRSFGWRPNEWPSLTRDI